MFRKRYLIQYNFAMYQPLNNQGNHEMLLKYAIVWFWGLFKTYERVQTSVPYSNVEKQCDKWDKEIEQNKQNLKLK